MRNLLRKRLDLQRENLEKTKNAMNAAFPDSNITDYHKFIHSLIYLIVRIGTFLPLL